MLLTECCGVPASFKLEYLKQASRLYDFAWNRTSVLFCLFSEVMINRNGQRHPYCAVRGEILGSAQDERLRKHQSRAKIRGLKTIRCYPSSDLK